MAFFKRKNAGGFMDEIRCDESSYLIWKWHPSDVVEGESNRENAIRNGSSLRVKDGEVAVFVYKQKNGTMQDFIVGPFDQKIKTKNFPILASLVGLSFEGGTPFQAEIYFINLAKIIQVRFGVPFFDVYDPRFKDFGVPVAVRGTISFKIDDYKSFIKLHRLSTFDLYDFQLQVKDAVARYVKDVVANAPAVHDIPLVQIETKLSQINDAVEFDIRERMKETFGVEVSGFDIATIEIDKSSRGYRELMNVTKEVTTATIFAETEAKVKNIADMQRINAKNYEEALRIQREEAQYAQHKQTQSSNLGAFTVESQTQVGVAGAEALGKLGSNGAGNIDMSGSGNCGNGFNMTAMMASMAVGSVVGKNIANSMNDMMSNVSKANTTVPPVVSNSYYVVVNGQSTGPYDMNTITQLIKYGHLKKDSQIWTSGLPNWVKAEEINEINELFKNTVPPVPPTNDNK